MILQGGVKTQRSTGKTALISNGHASTLIKNGELWRSAIYLKSNYMYYLAIPIFASIDSVA